MLVEASLLLAVFFVGTDFVAVKYTLHDVPPLVLAALRFTVAGILLYCIVRVIEPASRLRRKDLLPMLGLGLVGVTLNQTCYIAGLGLTGGSEAALMFATAPVWGLLLGIGLRLERAGTNHLLGMGLALAGVTLVIYDGLGLGSASPAGDLLVLASAAAWGGYAMFSLPVLRRYSPLAVAAYSTLFGGLIILLLASSQLFSMDWRAVGIRSWAGLIYSTLFSSAFAFTAWQQGVSRMGANRVLVYLYLVTLVGATASVLLLGEGLGLLKLVGAAIILLGVYLVRGRRAAAGTGPP